MKLKEPWLIHGVIANTLSRHQKKPTQRWAKQGQEEKRVDRTGNKAEKSTRLRVRTPGSIFQLCHLPVTLVRCNLG